MTDQQMMLLEQITYVDSDVCSTKGYDSVEQIIQAVENNLNDPNKYNSVTIKDYTNIVNAIKNDPELMSLEITARGNSGEFVFENPAEPGQAYVAFQGTYDGDEWADNFYGLGMTDTPDQKEALDFIESLDPKYEHISVVGHSKGGNKAMYVSFLSDRVDHCVSMDGQYFSEEFYAKYPDEVAANIDKIRAYALETDFVNIIFRKPDGLTEPQYIINDGSRTGAQNHFASALLLFDENGNLIPLEQSTTTQSPGFIYLQDFTEYISTTMSTAEKYQVGEYLGPLLALIRCENYTIRFADGTVYTHDTFIEYIASNPAALGTVFAYLSKYVTENHLGLEEVNSLLKAFLGKELSELLGTKYDGVLSHASVLLAALTGNPLLNVVIVKLLGEGWEGRYELADVVVYLLLYAMSGQLGDGKNDPILEELLKLLQNYLKDSLNVDIDLVAVWRQAERTYGSIGPRGSGGAGAPCYAKDFDYSQEVYDALMTAIATVDSKAAGISTGAWNVYNKYGWFTKLFIRKAVEGVQAYSDYLLDNNANCKAQIERIFSSAWQIDDRTATNLGICQDDITKLCSLLQALM